MLRDRFDGAVVVDPEHGRNDPEHLARLSPTGEWRVGAFEITRLDDDAVLYSKLETKKHLVGTRIKVMGQVIHDDAPFNEWVEKWF